MILFGIGSPILIDYAETLFRVGTTIAAGIKNRDGASYLPEGVAELRPETLDAATKGLRFLVPLFTPAHRVIAVSEARTLGLAPAAALIDPTSILPRRAAFGDGSFVNAGCCLGAGSRFGAFVLLNRSVTIGHDADFADFVSTGPGAVVAGNVTVGEAAMLGAGCTILPGVTIGARAMVGAGSVVTRDVPPHCLAVGNPARVVRDLGGAS